jgi:aryl-alcohol dehydrogenase-like predicted oxidoreductase
MSRFVTSSPPAALGLLPVRPGCPPTAAKLGVDQIDLLILHQALPTNFDRTLEAYRALETLLDQGKVRAIGVSNFMVGHLTELLDTAKVVPAVNQIEVHPYFQQREAQAFGAEHSILSLAWSPIGGITFYREGEHTSTVARPHHRPDRRGSLEMPGPGHAPLAPAAGPLGHSQVDQSAPHRRELRRLRLRNSTLTS